jgi:hypothetical protein
VAESRQCCRVFPLLALLVGQFSMTIEEIKTILANRLAVLASQRGHAVAVGDLARATELDAEINETQATLSQLNSL